MFTPSPATRQLFTANWLRQNVMMRTGLSEASVLTVVSAYGSVSQSGSGVFGLTPSGQNHVMPLGADLA